MALRMISADVHVIETPYTFELLEKGDEKYRPLVIQQISGATQFSNEANERKGYWLADNHAYAKDGNVDSATGSAVQLRRASGAVMILSSGMGYERDYKVEFTGV